MALNAVSRKLFIYNIAYTVGRTELLNYLQKFGKVAKLNVVYNKQTGLCKGYGFAQFEDKDAHLNVLRNDYHILDGRKLIVHLHESNNKHYEQ